MKLLLNSALRTMLTHLRSPVTKLSFTLRRLVSCINQKDFVWSSSAPIPLRSTKRKGRRSFIVAEMCCENAVAAANGYFTSTSSAYERSLYPNGAPRRPSILSNVKLQCYVTMWPKPLPETSDCSIKRFQKLRRIRREVLKNDNRNFPVSSQFLWQGASRDNNNRRDIRSRKTVPGHFLANEPCGSSENYFNHRDLI